MHYGSNYLSNSVNHLSHSEKGQCDRYLHFYVVFLITCQAVKQQGAPILDIFYLYI